MIYETVISTMNMRGETHLAPMGITKKGDLFVIAPFRPSQTLDNLAESGNAVINMTDDVSIIAGCLTGRRTWPLKQANKVNCKTLQSNLSHVELEVSHVEEDELRPRFFCKEIYSENHGPFKGFNRAQSAVIEAAILVSRLNMLSIDKIDSEIEYLKIAINKTAGNKELMAWEWLMESVGEHKEKMRRTEDL